MRHLTRYGNLQTVLSTIVARAAQLSGTEAGAIYEFDEPSGQFRLRATYGMTLYDRRDTEHHPRSNTVAEPDQVADLQPTSRANQLVMGLGYRARLVVPLLAPDQIVRALVVRRKARASQSTVELLQTLPVPAGPYTAN